MRKSRETKLYEGFIAGLWLGLLTLIFAVEATAQTSVTVNTGHGPVTAYQGDGLMVMYDYNATVIRVDEQAGTNAAAQLSTIVLMTYDVGGHYKKAEAWKIFMEECGCKDQSPKLNRDYFNRAWAMREEMLGIMPAKVLDELGQRFMAIAPGGGMATR
jgi:hypothetical protein